MERGSLHGSQRRKPSPVQPLRARKRNRSCQVHALRSSVATAASERSDTST